MEEEEGSFGTVLAGYHQDVADGRYEPDMSFRNVMAACDWQPVEYATGIELHPYGRGH